ELDGCGPAEDGDGYAELAAVGVDFFDDAVLVLERAIGHFHGLADFEADLRFHFFLTLAHLREHVIDFGFPHRDRFIFRPGETDYARRFANEIPGPAHKLIVLIEQVHVHDEVTWEKFPGGLAFFATLDF